MESLERVSSNLAETQQGGVPSEAKCKALFSLRRHYTGHMCCQSSGRRSFPILLSTYAWNVSELFFPQLKFVKENCCKNNSLITDMTPMARRYFILLERASLLIC